MMHILIVALYLLYHYTYLYFNIVIRFYLYFLIMLRTLEQQRDSRFIFCNVFVFQKFIV